MIISSDNGGPSLYPSYVTTMMGVKGIKKSANEKALAKAGLATGRAFCRESQ